MTEELETTHTGHTDSVIQRWIGVKTPREIADMTGMEPFEVVRRAHQILDEVDVLTLRQQQVQFLQNLKTASHARRKRRHETRILSSRRGSTTTPSARTRRSCADWRPWKHDRMLR